MACTVASVFLMRCLLWREGVRARPPTEVAIRSNGSRRRGVAGFFAPCDRLRRDNQGEGFSLNV
jgi:hypothetical protein